MADLDPQADPQANLQDWVGRTETVAERIHATTAEAMAATLLHEPATLEPGMALPALWHWTHFLGKPRSDTLGADGHARRGGFVPPVTLPRRMWGGSRLAYHQPLRIGEAAERTSTITRVAEKQGRSGALVIVTIEHRYTGESGLALVEEQDVVYREAPQPGQAAASGKPGPQPPLAAQWSRTTSAGPILLFRYSALTFNSHRIHYDHVYTTEVEGYPGLVVHGPLVATLLTEDLARQHPEHTLAGLTIRTLKPLFHDSPFHLEGALTDDGTGAELWCRDEAGALTLQATATFAAAPHS